MSKDISPEELAGAMRTIESDVDLPSRIRTSSIVGNLIGLEVGKTFTLSQELPSTYTIAELMEHSNTLKYKIRNGFNTSMRNAMKHTGKTYSMESAIVTYPSGRVFVQIVATCTGDAENPAPESDDDEV